MLFEKGYHEGYHYTVYMYSSACHNAIDILVPPKAAF